MEGTETVTSGVNVTGFDIGKFLHWVDNNPWLAIPLIVYVSTVYLSIKRDKSFFQVWFNGATPTWMMGKKHRDRRHQEEAQKASSQNKE